MRRIASQDVAKRSDPIKNLNIPPEIRDRAVQLLIEFKKVQQLPYQKRIKQPERENKEVQRANEILLKAATFFAQVELERPHK